MLHFAFAVSAGVLTVIGGMLVFATRTGPAEATSNLSKWVTWFGFNPPKWLIDRHADSLGMRVAFLFFIFAAGLFCAWVYVPVQGALTQAPSTQSATPSVQQNNQGSIDQQFNFPNGTLNINPQASKQDQETVRRRNLLSNLRTEYILGHDGISPALAAGTEQPPSEWINRRLEQLGENWRVP